LISESQLSEQELTSGEKIISDFSPHFFDPVKISNLNPSKSKRALKNAFWKLAFAI